MTLSIDDGTEFILPDQVLVDDGSVWRDLVGMWVDDGTVWRQIFPNVQIVMPDHARSYTGPDYRIGFGSGFSGGFYRQGITGGTGGSNGIQWMDPEDVVSEFSPGGNADLTQSAAFEIRYRLTSGSGPNGSLVADTWYPLYNTGANPEFRWTGTVSNVPFSRGFFDWRRVSDGVVIHSSAFNLN